MRVLWISILMVLLSSCLKEDVTLLEPPLYKIHLHRSLNYPHAFIDLNTKRLSGQVENKLWHLRFETNQKDWDIFLNPILDIAVHKTRSTDFYDVDSNYLHQKGLDWHRDVMNLGNLEPALGEWGDYTFEKPKSYNNIYILRVRYGTEEHYFKMQVLGATSLNYTVQYADLFDDYEIKHIIDKGNQNANVYFVLDEFPVTHHFEPNKKDWQLNFTYGLDSIHHVKDELMLRFYEGLGLYPRIRTKGRQIEFNVVDNKPFESIDYFFAKKREFKHADQLPNPMLHYNGREMVIKDGVTLLCRIQDRYFKMKLEKLENLSTESFEFDLVVQSL